MLPKYHQSFRPCESHLEYKSFIIKTTHYGSQLHYLSINLMKLESPSRIENECNFLFLYYIVVFMVGKNDEISEIITLKCNSDENMMGCYQSEIINGKII